MADRGLQGPPPVNSPVDENGNRLTAIWKSWFQRLYGPVGATILSAPYGQFYDTTTQAAAAGTPTPITFNSTSIASGVSKGTVTSKIYAPVSGVYNMMFSLQCENSAVSVDNISVWTRMNGADVVGSTGISAVAAKHGGVNGELLLGWNNIMRMEVDDYFQLYWMTDGGTIALTTIPASVSPARPQSPCAFVSLNFLSR